MTYRHSPLADEAPGHAEVVTPHDGHTYGGRVPAFVGLAQRGLGGVYFENPPGVEEGFRQTGLDFEVTLENAQTTVITDDGVSTLDVPNTKTTVGRFRDGRVQPFGTVGTRYRPIQNEQVASLGQLVVDGGQGSLRAIGAFGDPIGSRVYMAFGLGDFTVGGSDAHNLFLTMITNHDGEGGLHSLVAPIRVACTNQCSGIFGRRLAGRHVIRHTESAEGRVQEIRTALNLTWRYVDQYKAESERLLGESFTEHEFLAFTHELFGTPDFEDATARQRTIIGQRDEQLLQIWRSDTSEFGRGTRYAAAQGVYEYLDHYQKVRNAQDPDASRWTRILTGQTEAAKARAWELALAA